MELNRDGLLVVTLARNMHTLSDGQLKDKRNDLELVEETRIRSHQVRCMRGGRRVKHGWEAPLNERPLSDGIVPRSSPVSRPLGIPLPLARNPLRLKQTRTWRWRRLVE